MKTASKRKRKRRVFMGFVIGSRKRKIPESKRRWGAGGTVPLILVILALALGGCAKIGLDDTSSGGGMWVIETFHPCYPPECEPIGGNVKATGNDTTRGGNIGAEAKP